MAEKQKYVEKAVDCNFDEFKKVLRSRRSVRVFTEEPIPDSVVQECLDLALIAPNSSNLQSWEFYWVQSSEKKKALAEACLGQSAARTAQTLIVAVARTNTWKKMSAKNLEFYKSLGEPPQAVITYYSKGTLVYYGDGPLNIFAPFKTIMMSLIGLFRPIPRGPFGRWGRRLWATKTTALACENLMLAFRAAGFDSCPMEGFDESRVRKLLSLPSDASVVMVIGAGRRAEAGVYGPQYRAERELFVKKI